MFEKTRWETYGLIGIASLWAKWRDVFIEKLEIPLKTLSQLIVFYNNNKSNYYFLNAHSLPSTTYTKLHLILIIGPRDVILVIHMKKVRFSSLHICSGGETEKGAESGPKPWLIPIFFSITLSLHRDDEGVYRSLGSVCRVIILRDLFYIRNYYLSSALYFRIKSPFILVFSPIPLTKVGMDSASSSHLAASCPQIAYILCPQLHMVKPVDQI